MDIYVFKRADSSTWADYRLPLGAQVERHIRADSEVAIQRVMNAETGRVRALAERAYSELQQAPEPPVLAPIPQAVRERNFWQRLKWAFTRR